jgi:hypothetical protein
MSRLPHCDTQFFAMRRRSPQCTACGVRPAAEARTVCNTCRDRRWRERYPELHLWNNLKKSAKRRGYDFDIPYAWWLRWCEMTGFVEMVGRTKGSASIDRIDPTRGYHADNIQMLEVGANSAKGQHAPLDPLDDNAPF